MVFCNLDISQLEEDDYYSHNPYFNRWFSAICSEWETMGSKIKVTILILIDGFLQLRLLLFVSPIKVLSQSLF